MKKNFVLNLFVNFMTCNPITAVVVFMVLVLLQMFVPVILDGKVSDVKFVYHWVVSMDFAKKMFE